MAAYDLPIYLKSISKSDLKRSEKDMQIDVMRHWFYQNYEDPDNNNPYDKEDDKYIYLWGGPHDASDVLQEEFEGIVPHGVIQELVTELEGRCVEWSSVPSYEEYDDETIEYVRSSDPFLTFLSGIETIKELATLSVPNQLEQSLFKLLYVNTIAAMETYLSDRFIASILSDKLAFRKYVESEPAFKDAKIRIGEIFIEMEQLEERVKTHLKELIWHKLHIAKVMYKSAFNVEFHEYHKKMYAPIIIRHDIVHRNGKTKEGNSVVVEKGDLVLMIDGIVEFINKLESDVNPGSVFDSF